MKNRKVVITGAHSGLGLELVREFHKRGYFVVSVGRTPNLNLIEELEDRYEQKVFSLNRETIQQVLSSGLLEEVDILINNAGETVFGEFSDLSDNDTLKIIETNFVVPTLFGKRFLRNANSSKVLVNVTSITGKLYLQENLLYSICKGAMSNIFGAAAFMDRRGGGCRVIDYCPGSIATDFHRKNSGESTREGKRMSPNVAARILLDAIEGGKAGVIYPDLMAKIVGHALPNINLWASRLYRFLSNRRVRPKS